MAGGKDWRKVEKYMDNIIVRFLTKVSDLIVLNLLFMLCSLPVITAGASLTALYTVLMQMVDNQEGYIVKGFFSAFRKNLKQSTVIWLVLLAVGVFLGADILIVRRISGILGNVGMVFLGVAVLFYIVEIIFVFPLIARFNNTNLQMFKNAVLIPVSRLPYALLIIILTGLCIGVTFLNEKTVLYGAVLWNVIGVSLVGYAQSFLLNKMLEPFFDRER